MVSCGMHMERNLPKSGWDMSPEDLEYFALEKPDVFFELLEKDQDTDLMFSQDAYIPTILRMYSNERTSTEVRSFLYNTLNTWCGDIVRLRTKTDISKIEAFFAPYYSHCPELRDLYEKVRAVSEQKTDTSDQAFYNAWYR